MNIFNKGQQQYSGFSTSLKSGNNEPATGNAGDTGEKSPFNVDEPIVTNAGTQSSDLVDLKGAQRSLIMADDNRDGVVDQRELANASYQLLSNEDATPEEQGLGQLFGTMVMGGKSGKGLFPDIDQNGGITETDLNMLARGDDDAETISAKDFKAAFGDEVNSGGNTISLDELEQIASGESPVNYGVGAEDETEAEGETDEYGATKPREKEKPVNGDEEDAVTGDDEKPVTGDKKERVNGDKEEPVNKDKEKPVTGDKEDRVTGDKDDPECVTTPKDKKETPKDKKDKNEPGNTSSDAETYGYLATIFDSLGQIFGSFSDVKPKNEAADETENAGAPTRSAGAKDTGSAYGVGQTGGTGNTGNASKTGNTGNSRNQGANDQEEAGADNPMMAMMTILTSVLTMLMSLFGGGGQQKA